MSDNLRNKELFNIDLLALNKDKVKLLGEVKSAQILESSSHDFKSDGLFSTSIFGQVGSAERQVKFGYIDLKYPLLHPLVYLQYCELSKLYQEILNGKTRVKFDSKLGNFIPDPEGHTGYTYFTKHMRNLKLDSRESDKRDYKIKLAIKGSQPENLTSKWLVIPAGLRDYHVDENGRPTEDEVNSLYRKLLANTNMLSNIQYNPDTDDMSILDPIRINILNTTLAIYKHFENMLKGKSKFIQDKWAKRAITYSTRNVLSPAVSTVKHLDSTDYVSSIHITCGLLQFIKGILPITVNRVIGIFLNNILKKEVDTALLVNPKTYKSELVQVSNSIRSELLSMEGINSLINKMLQDEYLKGPVKVGDNYLLLLIDDKLTNTITIIEDTNNLPEEYKDIDLLNDDRVRPITNMEMFYIAVYDIIKDTPSLNTRYPITGLGSIFPAKTYVKTTTTGRTVKVRYLHNEKTLIEYPILDLNPIRTASFPSNNLARTGADFDGDSVLTSIVYRRKKHITLRKKTKFTNRNNKIDFKFTNNAIIDDKINSRKGNKIPIVNKMVVYKYGLQYLEEFPRGELIKKEGNKEFYKVPDDIEILTFWNGEEKWVKPESFSVHKNLRMLSVKTHKGNSLEVSDDHSLVCVDENMNFKRTNPCLGMCLPRVVDSVDRFMNSKNYIYELMAEGIRFKLNEELGYLFGAIIGDGWVNHGEKELTAIMLANTEIAIVEAVENVLRSYGYIGNRYTKDNPHTFDGHECMSYKHTWYFPPIAKLLRKHIGHRAENKQLPEWWVNTPRGFRLGLLAGLTDTDGTVNVSARQKISYSYLTVSRKLAYQILGLVNSLGLTAGLYIHQRPHKTTTEYTVMLSNNSTIKAKSMVKLRHPKKAETLANINLSVSEEHYMFTPNVTEGRLLELRAYLSSTRVKGKSNIGYKEYNLIYGTVAEALRKAVQTADTGVGGYFNIPSAKRLIETYPDFFNKDEYWRKFKEYVYNKNIEWEVIREIKEIPEITEAYDLTVPPYNTFIAQNGIVVYDTVSTTFLYTEESKKEVNNLLNNKFYYIAPDGSFTNAPSGNKVVELVLQHMTSEPNVNANKEEHVVESTIGTLPEHAVNNTREYGMHYADEIKDSNNPVTVTKVELEPINKEIETKYDKLLKAENVVLLFNADIDNIDKNIVPSVPTDYLSVNKRQYPTINRDKRIRVFPNIQYATFVFNKNYTLPRSAVVCTIKNIKENMLYTPSSNDIPYVNITHEKWYMDNAELEVIGEVLFTGIADNSNSGDITFNVPSSNSLTGIEKQTLSKLQFILRD